MSQRAPHQTWTSGNSCDHQLGAHPMTFNQVLGSGNVLVSDTVKLSLDISAIKGS
jgi:hypothetical protein